MNIKTLLALAKIRDLKPAKLSRLSGISRQSISAWKKRAENDGSSNVNIYSQTQANLAKVLGLKLEDLTQEISLLEDKSLYKQIQTELLWDHLYPDLETFAAALVKKHNDALARLVQVYGLYQASKIAGKAIWQKFPEYKKKIHPARQNQLETIWKFEKNPA